MSNFEIESREGRFCVIRKDSGYVVFDGPTYESAMMALHDKEPEFLTGPAVATGAAVRNEIPAA